MTASEPRVSSREAASSAGVVITIAMTIKPDLADAVCAGIPAMLADTRGFAGFREIRVVRHGSARNRLLIVERWDREEDYSAYMAWRNRDGEMDAARAHLVEMTIEVWPELVGHVVV